LCGGTLSAAVALGFAAGASTVGVPCTGPNGGEAGLKMAINDANTAGGGTVNLAAHCTYTLTTAADPNVDAGLPRITTSITINGDGSTITRDPAAPDFGIFAVDSSGNLTLNYLVVTHGAVL